MPTGTQHETSNHPTVVQTEGRVISFHQRRSSRHTRATRPDHTVVAVGSLLAWHEAREFAVGGFYREVPTGRVGRYMGPAEVHALDLLDISTVVLVFRCAATGQMYSYSQLDAQRGVAYEEVDG
jgi:hypothetical protein